MKTIILIHLLVAIGLLALAGSAPAQQMPQDNWRYDGLEFSGPDANKPLRSIAICSGGVYVGYGDPATSIVQFTENGVFIREFGSFGYILGIACDSNGNVYVLDRADSKIKAYTGTGTFIREWGGPGNGNGQFGLAGYNSTTAVAVAGNNDVFVCDPGNSRVQVFASNGNFLRTWGEQGALPGQFSAGNPYVISASVNREILISSGYSPQSVNASLDKLAVFSVDGAFIRHISGYPGYLPVATAPDGLVATKFWSNGYRMQISSSELTDLVTYAGYDLGGDWSALDYNSVAFDVRGNLFLVRGTKTRVLEREFSNVRNSLIPPAIPQPSVIEVAQREGTTWLDVDYQVVDADSSTVTTASIAFLNGNNTLADVVPMRTFREGTVGNIGQNVATNTQKRITWDMAADWSVDYAQIQVEVLAKDSRNPLGIHWITVPAYGGNPAIEVSKEPITDADLLDLWYWFIASQNPGVSFANGKVTGTTGLYSGQLLASGITTTTAGRLFAAEQLGVSPITWAETIRALAGNYGFTSIDYNSVVREIASSSSFLKGWGSNSNGQVSVPASSNGAVKVAAGSNHSLFVKSDGTLWAMGYNGYGQLGDGSTTSRNIPVQVATGVSKVAAAVHHSLVLKTDGTLWAMGLNSNGQLGDGSTTNRSVPVHVASGVSQIATGGNHGSSNGHSLFIKTDGTLWAMGYNAFGQLGDGSTIQRTLPVQISTAVAQIACGGGHNFFVKTDGSLWGMGSNSSGELGLVGGTNRIEPNQVTSNVTKVAARSSHSLFLKTDGSMWAMGNNNSGQLGDTTTISRTSPVQVATNVIRIACGQDHSLFVKSDNSLWAAGANGSEGRLGDGTAISRSTPIQVEAHVGDIAAGYYHSLAVIVAP